MWDEPTGQHCDVCEREKKPQKIWIDITEESKDETGIDRVRRFIGDKMSGGDGGNRDDTPESSAPTDAEGYYEETFYICPHLPCDGREETIREMERWEMEHDPDREFSKEKLDEIVAETVEQEKNDHRILDKNADEVYRSMVEEYEEDDTDATDG